MQNNHKTARKKIWGVLVKMVLLGTLSACQPDLQSCPRLQDAPSGMEEPSITLEEAQQEIALMQRSVQETSLPHGT